MILITLIVKIALAIVGIGNAYAAYRSEGHMRTQAMIAAYGSIILAVVIP